jgi:hypothetical protein
VVSEIVEQRELPEEFAKQSFHAQGCLSASRLARWPVAQRDWPSKRCPTARRLVCGFEQRLEADQRRKSDHRPGRTSGGRDHASDSPIAPRPQSFFTGRVEDACPRANRRSRAVRMNDLDCPRRPRVQHWGSKSWV